MNFKKLLAVPALVVSLLIAVQLSRSIISIYGRGGRVEELAVEVTELEKEKEGLEREKEFRETSEFVEREARDKLRMVKDGEHILVLPDSQDGESPPNHSQVSNGEEGPNWRKWVEFWLRYEPLL